MLKDKPVLDLVNETNKVLSRAVDKGLKDNMPADEMVGKLRQDVFVFSACKTHIELKQVSTMLLDKEGKIQSWQNFQQQVTAIHQQYNENYLQAEYIFATSSAEMAGRWSQFEKDGDRYNLQYRTAQDNKVRESHRAMAGITLPVDDPFWDSYFPPNGWRCRCTTVQVPKNKYAESDSGDSIKKAEVATTQIDSKGRNRGEMFRFNPGKQAVIFPPNHPYYKIKQGISSILQTILETSSEAGIAEQRVKIKNWAKENLLGRTIVHSLENVPYPITFSVNGIKEYLNQPHKHYGAKNLSLRNIESLVKSAKYHHSSKDIKGKPYVYHYLKTNIGGESSYVVIREDLLKKTAIVYSNVDQLRQKK